MRYIWMAVRLVTTTTRLRMSHLRLSTTARYSRRCAGSCDEAAAGAACARSRSGGASVSEGGCIRRLSCIITLFLFRGATTPSEAEKLTPTKLVSGCVMIAETGGGANSELRIADCGMRIG